MQNFSGLSGLGGNSAIMDKLARERTKLSEIPGVKGKAKYMAVRYLSNEVDPVFESDSKVVKIKGKLSILM